MQLAATAYVIRLRRQLLGLTKANMSDFCAHQAHPHPLPVIESYESGIRAPSTPYLVCLDRAERVHQEVTESLTHTARKTGRLRLCDQDIDFWAIYPDLRGYPAGIQRSACVTVARQIGAVGGTVELLASPFALSSLPAPD